LFAQAPCFSQTKNAGAKINGILSQYNSYLKTVHLNQLVKAGSFAYNKSISQKGANGLVARRNVYVLTLAVDSAFEDQFDFINVWGKSLQILSGDLNVYRQLFFRLADITRVDPDSLAITIQNQDPKMSLYLIYFDGGIKVVEPPNKGRGKGGVTTTPVYPDDLNNVLYGYVFKQVNYSPGLEKKLIAQIKLFLSQNKGKSNNSEVTVPTPNDPVVRAPGFMFFEARNFKGRITPGYYEDITVNLIIVPIPSSDGKAPTLASISYTYSVLYSPRRYTGPATIENSENAVIRYKADMVTYGNNLLNIFISTIH
jgi:hypothetical protein